MITRKEDDIKTLLGDVFASSVGFIALFPPSPRPGEEYPRHPALFPNRGWIYDEPHAS